MVNGFKKEIMFFMRGPRFYVMLLVTIALAISTPLMFAMMSSMMSVMSEADTTGQLTESMSMFTNVSSSFLAASTAEYVTIYGTVIMFFMYKGTAGAEQQKRSIMIPQCSGLTPVMYALPKFLFYVPFAFVVMFIAMLSGTALSIALFGGSPDWGAVLMSCLCAGVYSSFFAAVQFTLGLCTGKPGLSVALSILMQMILPSVLSLFRVDKFNPLALPGIAETLAYKACGGAAEGGDLLSAAGAIIAQREISTLDLAVSLGTAVVLGVLLVFLTFYVLSSKQVDNKGNEPVL